MGERRKYNCSGCFHPVKDHRKPSGQNCWRLAQVLAAVDQEEENTSVEICRGCGRRGDLLAGKDRMPQIVCTKCGNSYHWLCAAVKSKCESSWTCRECTSEEVNKNGAGNSTKERLEESFKDQNININNSSNSSSSAQLIVETEKNIEMEKEGSRDPGELAACIIGAEFEDIVPVVEEEKEEGESQLMEQDSSNSSSWEFVARDAQEEFDVIEVATEVIDELYQEDLSTGVETSGEGEGNSYAGAIDAAQGVDILPVDNKDVPHGKDVVCGEVDLLESSGKINDATKRLATEECECEHSREVAEDSDLPTSMSKGEGRGIIPPHAGSTAADSQGALEGASSLISAGGPGDQDKKTTCSTSPTNSLLSSSVLVQEDPVKRPSGGLEECLEILEVPDHSRSQERLSLSKRKRAHPAAVEDQFQGTRCVVNQVKLRKATKYNDKPQKADQGGLVRSRCVVNLRRLDSKIFSKLQEDIETVQEQVKANEMESLSGDQNSFNMKSCSVRVAKVGLSTILKYAMGRGRELGFGPFVILNCSSCQ